VPDVVGTDTLLEGDLPEGVANYSSLATFAAKTELDWENELRGNEETRWGDGVLDGLFRGLEKGQPFSIALFQAFLDATIGGVEGFFEDVGEVLEAISDGFSGKWLELSGTERTANKGAANGYTPLYASAMFDSTYLPSYVDDVLEYANLAAFPATGAAGTIYIAVDTGDTYRWSGSIYVRISDRVASTGITDSTTTGRSLLTAANAGAAKTVLSLTKSDVGLGSVEDTADAAKSVASAATLTTARTIDGASFNGSANILTPAALLAPRTWVSGNYYYANSTGAVGTSAVLVNNVVRVIPWVVTSQVSITALFAEYTVAGNAGSTFRIGIWNDDGSGRPGTLLLDAGTFPTDGSPAVTEVVLGSTLVVDPGLYWIGGALQNAATTQPTFRVVTSPVMPNGPLGTSLPTIASFLSFIKTGISGAFGTITSPTLSSVGAPRIGFKVA
jgi:hypothetical protein